MEMTTITLLLLVPLAIWRIYSRLRRLMGRNRSELWRHYAAGIVLPLALLVWAGFLVGHWLALGALLLGSAVGAGLGAWNMKLSRLENTAEGFFYTPNQRLGILISLLFVSRLIYRLLEAYLHMHNGLPMEQDFARSPLTVLLFGVLAGFFGGYNLLLLRWRRASTPVPRPPSIFDIK